MTATIENLERLTKLRDQGAITEEEFEKQKKEILNSSNTQAKTGFEGQSNFDKEKFKVKKVSIAAFTEKGRKNLLEKQKIKYEKKGWKFVDYHENGMSSYANFLEPKQETSIIAIVLAAILAIIIFAAILPDEKNNQNTKMRTNVSQQKIKEWYEKGSLHKSTIKEWKNSAHDNKIATSADWILSASKNIKSKIKSSGNIDNLKPYCEELAICIDKAVEGHGNWDNSSTTETAISCMVLMGWLK